MAIKKAAKQAEDPLDRLETEGTLPFEMFVTFKVNQLSMAFERQWTRYMRDRVGLSLAEWRVAATLASRGRATFAQAVNATGMNKSLCSRCVATLQEQGLISVQSTPGDSRSLTLALSDSGRNLVSQLRPAVIERQRMLLGSLTRTERIALYSAIDKLHVAAAGWENAGHAE